MTKGDVGLEEVLKKRNPVDEEAQAASQPLEKGLIVLNQTESISLINIKEQLLTTVVEYGRQH